MPGKKKVFVKCQQISANADEIMLGPKKYRTNNIALLTFVDEE